MSAIEDLVVIETVERLIGKAYDLIREGKGAEACVVLHHASRATSSRTASVVKDPQISDSISRKARENVAETMTKIAADRNPGIIGRAVTKHYNGEVLGVIRTLKQVREETGMTLAEAALAVRAEYAERGLAHPHTQEVGR